MKKYFYRAVSILLLLSLVVIQFYGNMPVGRASAQGSAVNPEFRFTSISGSEISTMVSPGTAAIIIFGKTNCGITQRLVKDIAGSEWINDTDISVIFVECNSASMEETKKFSQAYGCDKITFCYDIYGGYNSAWNAYCDIGMELGNNIGSLPTTAVINENNYVQTVLSGYQSPDTLLAEIRGKDVPGNSGEEDPDGIVNVELEGTEGYAFAYEIANLVNQARAEKGLPALGLDEGLFEVAMLRAAELSIYYNHTRPNGSMCTTASSRGTRKSENIAVSYSNPKAVMEAWMGSEGHYANIMDEEVTSIGVGCFMDSEGTWNWVQFFDNEAATEVAAPSDRQVVRTISVQKSLLQLQTDGDKVFTDSDINKELEIDIFNVNQNHSYSKPKLLRSGFSYKSSMPSVATVSDNGVITLKGVGTAVITASLKSDSSVFVDFMIQIKGTTVPTPPVVATMEPVITTPVPTPTESATLAPVTPEPLEPTEEPVLPTPSEPVQEPICSTQPPNSPKPDTVNSVLPAVSKLEANSGTVSVKLNWKNVSGAEGYILYQYNSKEKIWDEIATIQSGTTSYTIKKLQPGTAYRFAVKAYAVQNSVQTVSGSYKAIYTATKPQTVNFRSIAGKGKATLKWSKVKGATGYIVYYKTGKNAPWKKLKDTKNISYTKKKLKQGKNYYFTVKAYKLYKNKKYIGNGKTKKVKVK